MGMNYNLSQVQIGRKKNWDENASAVCGTRVAHERDRGEYLHAKFERSAEEIAGSEGDLRGIGALGDARMPSAGVGAAADDSRFLRLPEIVVSGAVSSSRCTGRSEAIGDGTASAD